MNEDTAREDAVKRGIEFLRRRQMPDGRFRMIASRSIDLANPKEDSSIFTTAVVAYSMSFCNRPEVHAMNENALRFLLAQMHAPGYWSYWTSDSLKTIPIDLDDTACTSMALKASGWDFPANRDRLLNHRDEQGRFLTWLFDGRLLSFEKDLPLKHHGNIDPVVNANLLAYLGYEESLHSALEYVMEWIRLDEDPGPIGYYLDKTALYYAVSRAFHLGVTPFAGVRDKIAENISARFHADKDFDILQSALAVCTLLNLSADTEDLRVLARKIICEQQPDGSWPPIAMYFGHTRFHGSAELTTALCLEALERLRLRPRPEAGCEDFRLIDRIPSD